MEKRNPSFRKPKADKYVDMSKQSDFLFNRTPILASALQRLKKQEQSTQPKKTKPTRSSMNLQELEISHDPSKKVKKNPENMMPSFAYTPLQKDLFNFYTINKVSLKMMESVPEPKFEVGSILLVAICDRGIGGKYLVANLFRNKKGYIDFKQVSQINTGKEDFSGIESYQEPGDFVVCSVVKSISHNHLQLSLSKFIEMDPKSFRIGQVIPAEIRSKEELGCHLIVYKCPKYKFFLPKSSLDDEMYEELSEKKQILATIVDVDHTKHLVKVQVCSEDHNGFNLRGVEEQEMSKLELEQYVCPGTLVNTKILKILKNGVLVKFLKIFMGFIHADHLDNNLDFYAVDAKIEARIIYSCLNPPFIFLSQRHVNLHRYQPKRALYFSVSKPNLSQIQNSYLNKEEQFFIHPSQLHSQIDNIGKFWVKENNYFERYQIMTSRKMGLRVGQISKQIPFNNFKVFGEGKEGSRFKVLCLDVWNKVVKISYDQKVLKSNNMLYDLDDVKEGEDKLYCGVIKGINENGVNVEFCNNIRGSIPKNQLKLQGLTIDDTSKGKGIDVYISHIKHKKNFVTLTLLPPALRKTKTHQQVVEKEKNEGEETMNGTIVSIDQKSINPIYVKLKSRLVKISIFNGIKPAALGNLPIIRDLKSQFEVGQQVRVFRKAKQYFLYPPEQLSDKNLRICRVVGQKGSYLRLQIGKSQFKNCHICDITDMILPYPFSEVSIGEYHIARVLSNGFLCLRNSVVMNGIPKSMLECKQKYGAEEERGDYRNRILTVGSGGLKEDMVMFGYIKNFSEKGCFISITNDFEARVQLSQLSDHYIGDKVKHYPNNKLMLIRLISQKVKPNDPTKHLFDGSARESIVKMGYPITEEALMTGLTVEGSVTGYSKGKALIKLDGSKFTGIMNPNEVEGINRQDPIQKSMKLGTHYKMKIIEYSNEGRRLIRLSTLPKYFKKFPGIELNAEEDGRVINLWENYQTMLKQAPPAPQVPEAIEMEEEDEYERIKGLLAQQEDGQMDEDQAPEEDLQIEQQQNDEQEDGQQEDEQEDEQESEQEGEEQEDNMMEQEQELQPPQPTVVTLPQEEVERRLAQFRKMNQSPQLYQSIVLANDSSESHIQYISAMVSDPKITPDQIREQFSKSIALLESIKDKENMWISWLNMELILGDFMGVVKRAISCGVGIPIYARIIQILREQENWEIAFEMARKMLKKFNKDIKAYYVMLRHLVLEEINNKGQARITLKEILKRASQCLKQKDLVTIQSQYGKILYQQKQSEKARTVLEGILINHPKRTDLWSMYVDLEVKHGTLNKARQILERCLTLDLKKKKMVSILKKYYQIEETYGDSESASRILARAKSIAQNYTGQQMDDSGQEED